MKRALLGILFCALSGCASLNVNVSVVNPVVIETEVDRLLMRDVLPEVIALRDEDIQWHFDDVQNKHFQLYVKAQIQLRIECAKPERAAALDGFCDPDYNLQNDFNEHINPQYDEVRADVKAKRAAVEKAYNDLSAATQEKQSSRQTILITALRDYQYRIRNFATMVKADVSLNDGAGSAMGEWKSVFLAIAPGINAAQRKELTQQQEITAATMQAFLDRQGLGTDPYAYAVASARDDKWADRYNISKATGNFGSTDIAIRMISLDNFTIKGMAFDPSDVAQMASKVLSQSVLLAAQIAGVPISSSNPTGAGAALAKTSTSLEQLEDTLAKRKATLADQRQALLDIAASVARERAQLNGSDKEREQAITAIKAVFDAHVSRLTTGGN